MLGRWWEHRSQSGHDHANNTSANPHYQAPSQMPDDGQPDSNFVYFYHRDHLGSTGFVTASDAELYSHVQYFPSGEPWVDQRANTERLPYLLTDKELDQETGLYYFGARYYDPRIGLWASTDPAQTEYLDRVGAGGLRAVLLSTYAYAANNPLIFIDPDGRSPWYVRAWRWVKTDGPDYVQDGLDVASMAMESNPVTAPFSSVPDILNAGISESRGDREGAILSLGAAVPLVGNAANAARLTRSAAKRAAKAQKAAPVQGRRRPTAAQRERTWENSKDTTGTPKCEYCDAEITKKPRKSNSFEVDHRTPYSRGGPTTDENLAPSCRTCNRRKGAKTPEEFQP
jgi:RHS repeat-associated protein